MIAPGVGDCKLTKSNFCYNFMVMLTYLVEESKKITPSTLLLTLRRDEGERPLSFQPGQYSAINFEHQGKKSPTRCFSIVSGPTDQDILQFSMRVRGRFTTAVSKLEKDDLVNVTGPFGGFVFDLPKDKNAVFMAGGIGITPFMSMMRHLDKLNADNQVTLLYSCANQEDIPFKEELLEINKNHPNLHTIFVIGDGPADKIPENNVATGRLSDELLDKVTKNDYTEKKFFVCGPPGFMAAMAATVMKKGVNKERILTEAFTQSSPKQTSILRSWPANVYAMGAIGVILGSFVIMESDLLKALPPITNTAPTKNSPFLVTNARQKQLDQLVNAIPPSPSVITAPTTTKSSSASSTPITVNTPPPTFAPIYSAPAPRTTSSIP